MYLRLNSEDEVERVLRAAEETDVYVSEWSRERYYVELDLGDEESERWLEAALDGFPDECFAVSNE